MEKNKLGTVESNKSSTPKATIGLRPYFAETDKKYVHYLFYSTYFNLVPKAVRLRLQSPFVIGIWLALYALLITTATRLIHSWPPKLTLIFQVFVTLASVGGGLVGLFWFLDKFDVTDRVIEGVENDLKEPDHYYRGTPGQARQGNFWVLTLNDEIVGCIGMDHNQEQVTDSRKEGTGYVRASERPRAVDAPEIQTAEWKRTAYVLAKLDDWIRLILVGVYDLFRDLYIQLGGKITSPKKKVLFEAHKPNEASVRRLAVKHECQNHGLSTVLLKRVAFWAHAHQIEYLYAETDELQTKCAEILEKRHGYKLVSKKKVGFFKTKSVYRLDVKLWMSEELEKRAEEKRKEEELKEEEELKRFE
jgi:GNAT superfamily N-acetyltransferase